MVVFLLRNAEAPVAEPAWALVAWDPASPSLWLFTLNGASFA